MGTDTEADAPVRLGSNHGAPWGKLFPAETLVTLERCSVYAVGVWLRIYATQLQRDAGFPADREVGRGIVGARKIAQYAAALAELFAAGALYERDDVLSSPLADQALCDRRAIGDRNRSIAATRKTKGKKPKDISDGDAPVVHESSTTGAPLAHQTEQNRSEKNRAEKKKPPLVPRADRWHPQLMIRSDDVGFDPWRDELVRRGAKTIADAALRAGRMVAPARFPASDLPTPFVPHEEAAE